MQQKNASRRIFFHCYKLSFCTAPVAQTPACAPANPKVCSVTASNDSDHFREGSTRSASRTPRIPAPNPVLNSAFRFHSSSDSHAVSSQEPPHVKLFSALPSFRLSALCVSVFSCLSASAQSPSPRPITIDDYFQIQAVHDPQLSPDAQWVAYSVDKSSLKTDKTETRIWM